MTKPVYEQGDPLPILASIYSAAKILRSRGIIIDLDREIPNRSSSDYWMSLRRLQNDLWRRVHETDSKCQQAAVKKIAEGLREMETCPLVITPGGGVERATQGQLQYLAGQEHNPGWHAGDQDL